MLGGLRKPSGKVFSDSDYGRIRELGDDHKSSFPRRIA